MFIRTMIKENGMTLMSVLVATALSGVIGLMVIRLMGNQAEAMLVVNLYEEREILINHYRHVVTGGWDRTMAGGGSTVYTRAGTSFPLSVKEDLYDPLPSGSGWWKISATTASSGGYVQQSDAYGSSGTGGLHKEDNYTVTLTVDFVPSKHPVINADLASRQELIYMGHRWQQTKQRGCGAYDHSDATERVKRLSRIDTRSGLHKPLYHPNSQGAVVSYSFHSNYTKCSQVPLVVNAGECPNVGAILGFESWGTATTLATPPHYLENPRYYRKNYANEYVTGRLACSYPLASSSPTPGSAWKAALGNERYYTLHNKVWSGTASSGNDCTTLDKSYVDNVTGITSQGTGGGKLTCEPLLIAPRTLNRRVTGNSISGCTVNSRGRSNCSTNSSYQGWNGSTLNAHFTYHAGGGGYQTGRGVHGIKSVGHSGGIREFTSTGAGSGLKPHPILAYDRLRGRPGGRGVNGGCSCKEGHERSLPSCKLP